MDYPLDHIGIVVEDLAKSIPFYTGSYGLEVTCREIIEERGIELVFLGLGNTDLELIAPLRPDSTVSKFLAERGPGLHHLCYKVADIRAEMKRLTGLGFELVDPTPRPGARGSEIAFFHPKTTDGVLTELLQYT